MQSGGKDGDRKDIAGVLAGVNINDRGIHSEAPDYHRHHRLHTAASMDDRCKSNNLYRCGF